MLIGASRSSALLQPYPAMRQCWTHTSAEIPISHSLSRPAQYQRMPRNIATQPFASNTKQPHLALSMAWKPRAWPCILESLLQRRGLCCRTTAEVTKNFGRGLKQRFHTPCYSKTFSLFSDGGFI